MNILKNLKAICINLLSVGGILVCLLSSPVSQAHEKETTDKADTASQTSQTLNAARNMKLELRKRVTGGNTQDHLVIGDLIKIKEDNKKRVKRLVFLENTPIGKEKLRFDGSTTHMFELDTDNDGNVDTKVSTFLGTQNKCKDGFLHKIKATLLSDANGYFTIFYDYWDVDNPACTTKSNNFKVMSHKRGGGTGW